jgi:hypothetical protein
MSSLRALRRYAREPPPPIPREKCELCGIALDADHRHVVDLERRSLCCACRPCALLFDKPGAAGGRYRAVRDRVAVGPRLAHDRWSKLGVPVQLAFVFFNSRIARYVGCYPSPGGAIESEVPAEEWERLARESGLAMEADVEAFLCWAPRGSAELETFLVPIDTCYELVALCRTQWKGFDGGDDVRRELDSFLARVRSRAAAGGG